MAGDTDPPTRLAVEQPTRAAERNQRIASGPEHQADEVVFPSLGEGVTLLDIDGGRGVTALQSLVLDHLLTHAGPAFWVDARGHATTTELARLAPSRRLLDRVHVARGFTAYQHHAAVCDLQEAMNQGIQEAVSGDTETQQPAGDTGEVDAPVTPSLIVAPAVDAHYGTEDTLSDQDAETLQARTLARLRAYAEGFDTPVLLTRSERDDSTATVERVADHRLECKQTRLGPRFVGEDFETLVYPVDGSFYQTTFAYWRQVLTTRATQLGVETRPTPPEASNTADVGTAPTMSGGQEAVATNPLHDAWTTAGPGGR